MGVRISTSPRVSKGGVFRWYVCTKCPPSPRSKHSCLVKKIKMNMWRNPFSIAQDNIIFFKCEKKTLNFPLHKKRILDKFELYHVTLLNKDSLKNHHFIPQCSTVWKFMDVGTIFFLYLPVSWYLNIKLCMFQFPVALEAWVHTIEENKLSSF